MYINQNDVKERGEQVQLMRSIYQKSTGVLAWVGAEFKLGLRALKILAAELANPEHHSIDFTWLRNLPVDFCGKHYEDEGGSPGRNFFWDAISDFLNSRYWERT